MKTKLFIGTIALVALANNPISAKEPVAMSINGKDIKLSEFEYLYNKNKQQQLEEQPFDKYVDMFVTYKLKVADAEALGIDTTKTFLNEFHGYRDDLAKPYLEDNTVKERLAQEAYERMKEEVDVSHIMVYLEDPKTKSRVSQRELLDSIRTCIVNGEDFGQVAAKYSIDPSVKRNNGHLGYIRSGMLPYSFEYAAYTTPKGEISQIIETQFGYHIIKPGDRRPSKGQVLVEHIMKLVPKGSSKEVADVMEQKMDSIYALVKAGADFEELAKKESDDPGSKNNGGKLPWFGTGQMVPEFEANAYSLAKGEICAPFATSYGFHIIKKLDSKELENFEEIKDRIISTFGNDERSEQGKIEKLAQLKAQYKYKVDEKTKQYLYNEIVKNNGFDSLFVSNLSNSNKVIISYAKEKIRVKDLINVVKDVKKLEVIAGKGLIDRTIEALGNKSIIEYEKGTLEANVPEFANLVNEYRDGLLLYEISNRNVWEKASKDREGLEAFFEKNKDKYAWENPKFKGILIQVANDSIANLVKQDLKTVAADTLIRTMVKKYKRDIKIEKVLVSSGENLLVDALVFNMNPYFQNPDKKYPVYFTFNEKLISAPEDVNDIKGQATVDYQAELEAQWISELKSKYKVTLNNKVLNKAK